MCGDKEFGMCVYCVTLVPEALRAHLRTLIDWDLAVEQLFI